MTDTHSAFDGLSALEAGAELSCCELSESASILHRWLREHVDHEAVAITTNGSSTPLSQWAGPASRLPEGLDWSSPAIDGDVGRPVIIAGADAALANATIVVVLTGPGAPPCPLEYALHGLARVLAARIGRPPEGDDPARVARAHAVAGERDRVTQELTDEFALRLHTIAHTLLGGAGGDSRARAREATGVASGALVELRGGRHRPRRQAREVQDAFGELSRELGDLARAAGIALEHDLAGAYTQWLPEAVLDAACWITRAATLNTVEHAGATRTRIAWRLDADQLGMVVADDGCGFDAQRAWGEGLDAMRWRAEALGGALGVESAPGWGTRIEARLNVLADRPVSADAPARALIGTLGERELDVLRLMAAGHRNRDIAAELFVSQHTVKFHVGRIFDKLDVRTRAEAAAVAFAAGLDARQPPASAAAA